MQTRQNGDPEKNGDPKTEKGPRGNLGYPNGDPCVIRESAALKILRTSGAQVFVQLEHMLGMPQNGPRKNYSSQIMFQSNILQLYREVTVLTSGENL